MGRMPSPAVTLAGAVLFAAVASTPLTPTAASASGPKGPAGAGVPLPRPEPGAPRDDAYTSTPLRFEQTAGRAASGADFIARGAGYLVGLAADRVTLVVGPPSEKHRLAIGMRLIGASASARADGHREWSDTASHLIGNDARLKMAGGVQSFVEVEYADVYPGIDVVYYGNQRQFEYDFIVKPGADYGRIALNFDGVRSVKIDRSGRLIIATAAATIVQRVPALYQEIDGTRSGISGGFVQRAGKLISFWIGKHDKTRPVIIDPILEPVGARD